jgi:hypothetical protein
MEKSNKPTVAGVFDIITGALGIIGAIAMFIGFSVVSGGWGIPGMGAIPGFVPGIVLGTAIPSLIIAVLALVGGIFAVQRKQWGWALAGSIAAILVFILLGVPAVILVAISKSEFA